MKHMKKILKLLMLLLPLLASAQESADTAASRQPIVLPPLFDYPVASEDMDWETRSNWLATHFWDSFDFKVKSVGQQQLNHAFNTWIVPLHYADPKVCAEAVESLVKKLDKNPTLLLQFTRAAEASIYSAETAQIWLDEAYLPFVRALIANKKIPATQKTRYIYEEKRIANSLIGEKFPALTVTDRWGAKSIFAPEGAYTLVEFGDPSCSECQMARIAIKSDDLFSEARERGLLRIAFILPDADLSDSSWMEEVADYPADWTVAAGEGIDEIVDIKLSPAIFLVNPEGKLLLKNVDFTPVREIIRNVVEEDKAKPQSRSEEPAADTASKEARP